MMTVAFTLCSNNYFAQAHALGRSFLRHHPLSLFYIVLVDKRAPGIVSDLPGIRILEIESIEGNIHELALRYNIIELNTAVKPQVFSYLFSHTDADQLFYLDPDIYVYRSFDQLEALLSHYQVLLTPHILKPIPIDGKTPQENDFLNYGIYNLGFIALRRSEQADVLLKWWKERTYRYGYIDLARGLFVDQLWINLAPVMFKGVYVLDHPGYNMGPWNLHERWLTHDGDAYYVQKDQPLYFYHFSTFDPTRPPSIHPVFNRFQLDERSDLGGLYQQYAEELLLLNCALLRKIPCFYVEWRLEKLAEQASQDYRKLSVGKKMARRIKRAVPGKVRESILAFISA